MAELRVDIVGGNKDLLKDLQKLSQSLNEVEKEQKDLARQLANGTITASGYSDAIKKLNTRASVYKNALSTVTPATDKFGKSTANAVPAVNEFSRVIQDAPFGIQGVANNITQLTQQFGYLSKQTGGTRAALKAMLGTLAGPAGILLAVSAVTSLLVSFGDQLFKSKDRVKNLKEEQEKLNEALDNYVLGLEATQRASLRGAQSAQKELVSLRALRSQAQNTTLSYQDRIAAVNELQKKYPSYFGNVKQEKILNGELKGSYDLLSASILKRAKSTAAMNAVVKNSEQLLVLEDQLAAKTKELNDELVRVEKEKANIQLKGGNNPMAVMATSGTVAASKIKTLREEVKSLTGSIQNLQLTNIDLEGKIDVVTPIANSVKKGSKKIVSALSTGLISQTEGITQLGTGIGKKLQEAITIGGMSSMFKKDDEGSFIAPILSTINQGTIAINNEKAKMINALTELSQGASDIINNNLVNAFAGIGQAIGSALSEGTNLGQSLGKVLLSSVGSILTQLGQLAIGIGIGLKAIKKSLTSLNPFAAIAAGVGLIALGKIFSAGAAKIGGSIGGGGGVSTDTGTQTSFGGSVSSGFTSGVGGNGTVVFEIAGTKLVGVLSNTLRQNRNLGGVLKFN